MGEGAFGQVFSLPSGQKQIDERDQRSTHPGGDQDVVGSKVALWIEVDQGFIRSVGHIGRLRRRAESFCEADHTGCVFFVAGVPEQFSGTGIGQAGAGQGFCEWANSFGFVSPGAAAAMSGYGCRRWSTPWNRPRCRNGAPSPAMAGRSPPCGRSSRYRRLRAFALTLRCGTKLQLRQNYSPAICSRGRALRSLPRSLASSLAI